MRNGTFELNYGTSRSASTMAKGQGARALQQRIQPKRDIQTLQVGLATVNRDMSYLRDQAKTNIKRYIDERLPGEYEKCLVGLAAITKEAWNTSQQTQDGREKIQALSLAKECYSTKLDLLTNATVVDDVIRFVSHKSLHKGMLKSSPSDSNGRDREKSKERDYDEDNDKLEEAQKEEEAGEITANEVF